MKVPVACCGERGVFSAACCTLLVDLVEASDQRHDAMGASKRCRELLLGARDVLLRSEGDIATEAATLPMGIQWATTAGMTFRYIEHRLESLDIPPMARSSRTLLMQEAVLKDELGLKTSVVPPISPTLRSMNPPSLSPGESPLASPLPSPHHAIEPVGAPFSPMHIVPSPMHTAPMMGMPIAAGF